MTGPSQVPATLKTPRLGDGNVADPLPRAGLVFALRGTVLHEEEFGEAGCPRSTVDSRTGSRTFRDANQEIIERLFKAFWVATASVLAEVTVWATQLLYA